MSIREECGVFGLMSGTPLDAANIAYYGLYALQHRGQESCGIVVNDDGVFVYHRDVGLVGEVFPIRHDRRRQPKQLPADRRQSSERADGAGP